MDSPREFGGIFGVILFGPVIIILGLPQRVRWYFGSYSFLASDTYPWTPPESSVAFLGLFFLASDAYPWAPPESSVAFLGYSFLASDTYPWTPPGSSVAFLGLFFFGQ